MPPAFSLRIPVLTGTRSVGLRRGTRSLKLLYFLLFAAIGAFSPFVNVYYGSIGLSGTQIGLVNTLGPLAGMLSAALCGMLNDRFGKTRLLMGIGILGAIAAALALSTVRAFALIVLIACVYGLFASTVMPLIDGTTMSLLGDDRQSYGALRGWGTLGFIVTTATVGFILDRTGLRAVFFVYALIMGLLLVASIGLPERPIHLRGSLRAGLGRMLRRPVWLFFMASVFGLGMASGGMSSFLSVMLKAMGGSDSLIGVSWTVAALSELPFMLFSARLLRRSGSSRLLAIGYFFYTLRMLAYSALPSAGWVLAASLLQGPSFGLYWISAVTYASELAPDDLRSTSQGLLAAATSLSGLSGAAVGGVLYDWIGPTGMFRVLAGCCVAALLLYGLGQAGFARKGRAHAA